MFTFADAAGHAAHQSEHCPFSFGLIWVKATARPSGALAFAFNSRSVSEHEPEPELTRLKMRAKIIHRNGILLAVMVALLSFAQAMPAATNAELVLFDRQFDLKNITTTASRM